QDRRPHRQHRSEARRAARRDDSEPPRGEVRRILGAAVRRRLTMVDFYRVFHDHHPDENGIIVADDGVSEYAYVANTGLWHREPLAGRIVLFGDEHYDRVRLEPEDVYVHIGQCRPIWNQGFGAKVLRAHHLQPNAEKRTSAELGLDPARVPPRADDAW